MTRTSRVEWRRRVVAALLTFLAMIFLGTAPGFSQDATAPEPGEGSVGGQVYDAETAEPLRGVTVLLQWPAPDDGSNAWSELQVTGSDGGFEFFDIAPGSYSVNYSRSGYGSATVTDIIVSDEELMAVADFPLTPAPDDDRAVAVDEIVVTATQAQSMLDEIDIRFEADTQVNILSAEDLSRFAAADVGDALKRVAGVNVVEGEFAIIRGLEDRYSSTTYNGAPLPSPDPDKQSVQLDLFPSDVVGRLVVSKTFASYLPSNSSGGGLDIVTHSYSDLDGEDEGLVFKVSAGSGFNERARNGYLKFIRGGSAGSETGGSKVTESDYSASLGGRYFVANRQLRFKALVQRETDYSTAEGFQESREPRPGQDSIFSFLDRSGDLALGQLSLSGGRYDLTQSSRDEQETAYLGLGIDLDEEGLHRIDGSILHSSSLEESVQHRLNGFLPNYDYATNIPAHINLGFSTDDIFAAAFPLFGVATLDSWLGELRDDPSQPITRGGVLNDSFLQTQSFRRDRELKVYQLNGEHDLSAIEILEGLTLRWAYNHARTIQLEESLGTNLIYTNLNDLGLIPSSAPVSIESRGAGGTYLGGQSTSLSENDVRERQDFYRLDLEYVHEINDAFGFEVRGGWWSEDAERSVEASFLDGARVQNFSCIQNPSCTGAGTQFVIQANTLPEIGQAVFQGIDLGATSTLRHTTNDSTREVDAWTAEAKVTLFEHLDLIAGVRREHIEIESINDPFSTLTIAGENTPRIFPVQYLFFDRFDNVARPFESAVGPGFDPSQATFNDEILGIDVPIDPVTGLVDLTSREQLEALVNGRIDEDRTLPSFAFTLRGFGLLQGLTLRAAYSKTVARPSFREVGYYVSVEPGTTDLVVGNPQLQLSDVRSGDVRLEYLWGDYRDFVAVSRFTKSIDRPIESIVVRDPSNFSSFSSASLYRTFFNNPNEASVRGWEFEISKNLSILSFGQDIEWLYFLEYLTLGANYTKIDADVERTDAEIERASIFFFAATGDTPVSTQLSRKRRLFGQPEWIANVNLSLDHPEWGTKFTLAWFAISDVLDSAGSAFTQNNGNVLALTLDRYTKSFNQLDFIVSQSFELQRIPGRIQLKASVKNITDSTRGLIYDEAVTGNEVPERLLKVGRDYSFSMSYEVLF